MPIYTFVCPQCSHTEDVICSLAEAKASLTSPATKAIITCLACPKSARTPMEWRGVEAPRVDMGGNSAGRFQMKAITPTGEKVAGHFGVSAKKNGSKKKKGG